MFLYKQKAPTDMVVVMEKTACPLSLGCFDPMLFMLAGNEGMHKILDEFVFRSDRTTD